MSTEEIHLPPSLEVVTGPRGPRKPSQGAFDAAVHAAGFEYPLHKPMLDLLRRAINAAYAVDFPARTSYAAEAMELTEAWPS